MPSSTIVNSKITQEPLELNKVLEEKEPKLNILSHDKITVINPIENNILNGYKRNDRLRRSKSSNCRKSSKQILHQRSHSVCDTGNTYVPDDQCNNNNINNLLNNDNSQTDSNNTRSSLSLLIRTPIKIVTGKSDLTKSLNKLFDKKKCSMRISRKRNSSSCNLQTIENQKNIRNNIRKVSSMKNLFNSKRRKTNSPIRNDFRYMQHGDSIKNNFPKNIMQRTCNNFRRAFNCQNGLIQFNGDNNVTKPNIKRFPVGTPLVSTKRKQGCACILSPIYNRKRIKLEHFTYHSREQSPVNLRNWYTAQLYDNTNQQYHIQQFFNQPFNWGLPPISEPKNYRVKSPVREMHSIPTNSRPCEMTKVLTSVAKNDVSKLIKLTKPMPFTFEERNVKLKQKREEWIQKVIQDEKRLREFRAKPIPKSLYSFQHVYPKPSDFRRFKMTRSQNFNITSFRAGTAKILQLPPFVPKKEKRCVFTSDFQLNTERRAKEREEFNKMVKEKEKQKLLEVQEMQEAMKLEEEQERMRIRKETVFVAQPIRYYKDVKPVAPKPLTCPQSPNFATDRLRGKSDKYFFNEE